MSVCGQTGHTEEDSGSEEVTATAAAVRDIYKQKPASKVVRVLTVLAYLLSVSLAAILLSVYYVCVWKSPELPPANNTGEPETSARTGNHSHYQPHDYVYNYTGGSDSTVNPLENATDTSGAVNITSTEESTFDSSPSATTPFDVESTTSADYTDDPIAANDTDSIT